MSRSRSTGRDERPTREGPEHARAASQEATWALRASVAWREPRLRLTHPVRLSDAERRKAWHSGRARKSRAGGATGDIPDTSIRRSDLWAMYPVYTAGVSGVRARTWVPGRLGDMGGRLFTDMGHTSSIRVNFDLPFRSFVREPMRSGPKNICHSPPHHDNPSFSRPSAAETITRWSLQ